MSVYSSVKNLTLAMRHGKLEGVYRTLTNLKLKKYVGRIFHHIQANKERKNPTEEMLASREYYKSHQSEIKHVCALLEDEESVKVYKAMWKFRCTHDYKCLPKVEEEKQYFGYDFFKYQEGEKLIDCGAYDGDTIDAFEKCMRRHGIKDYSVVAFEADPENARFIEGRKNVLLISKGVWDSETKLRFYAEKGADGKLVDSIGTGAKINDSNVINIPVCRIDDRKECSKATILKMDIEGAEWNALHGAERLIRDEHPKLAICLYHSDEDMVRIVRWIDSLKLGYRFYIRQHSDTRHETVIYGIL